MNLRTLTLGIGLGLAALTAAQPVGYAPKTETIAAGILIVPQDGADESGQ